MEIPETLMILSISVALTLFVEIPFQNLRRVLFEKGIYLIVNLVDVFLAFICFRPIETKITHKS